MSAWHGVDLDGTLASHTHSQGNDIGEPIPAAVERVKALLRSGMEVRIVTARAFSCYDYNDDGDMFVHLDKRQIALVGDWTEKVFGKRLMVTCCKDYNMVALEDDRAVQVIPNSGILLQDMYDELRFRMDGLEK